MPEIEITTPTYRRLQQLAEPLVDTAEDVIVRALDALEHGAATATSTPTPMTADKSPLEFSAGQIPDLTHTTVEVGYFNGQKFQRRYWNPMMCELIRLIGEKKTSNEVERIVHAPTVRGEFTDNGYKYIDTADLSVQGQDSNGAWENIVAIADALALPIEIHIKWLEHADAALPGRRAVLSFNPKTTEAGDDNDI
tara:strand:+ start:163 stop:747 length:585 start_codon:yes stop_codon:yes gene_type:complete